MLVFQPTSMGTHWDCLGQLLRADISGQSKWEKRCSWRGGDAAMERPSPTHNRSRLCAVGSQWNLLWLHSKDHLRETWKNTAESSLELISIHSSSIVVWMQGQFQCISLTVCLELEAVWSASLLSPPTLIGSTSQLQRCLEPCVAMAGPRKEMAEEQSCMRSPQIELFYQDGRNKYILLTQHTAFIILIVFHLLSPTQVPPRSFHPSLPRFSFITD